MAWISQGALVGAGCMIYQGPDADEVPSRQVSACRLAEHSTDAQYRSGCRAVTEVGLAGSCNQSEPEAVHPPAPCPQMVVLRHMLCSQNFAQCTKNVPEPAPWTVARQVRAGTHTTKRRCFRGLVGRGAGGGLPRLYRRHTTGGVETQHLPPRRSSAAHCAWTLQSCNAGNGGLLPSRHLLRQGRL